MTYPAAVDLPFNFASIRGAFCFHRPGSPLPAGIPYWLLLQGGALLVEGAAASPRLPEGELSPVLMSGRRPLSVGSWQGRPLLAMSIPRELPLPEGVWAEPFNSREERLDDQLLTLGGLGHQLLVWERGSAHCSRCGSSTESLPGSWGKRCPACQAEHFPHLHPCIIVLVRRGEEFLLVRKAEWPAGRYSLVAGFVDFGEALEECVAREVEEETGLQVQNIRYVGSQNWPFPSQLMAGFVADWAGGEPVVDRDELEDARWFCASDLPADLPGKRSIARWLIDTYALSLRPAPAVCR